MKLLLVTFSAIVVFTADCREFSNQFEGRGSNKRVQAQSEEQNFLDGNNLAENQRTNYDGQQIKEEKGEHHQRKIKNSKCKVRTVCVVMGGSCVTNETLCSGRLLPEGCKGNKKCQCCVPGTLEAKLDQLEEAIHNIYLNISAMLDGQCKNQVTTSPTPPTTAVNTTTTIVTTSPTPPTTTAHTTTNIDDCPEAGGFFKVPEFLNHCYKLFNESAGTWSDSQSLCQAEGLQIAKTDDPVSLRKFIVKTFGTEIWTWLGAKGTGNSVSWVRDGVTLSNGNSAWWSGQPSSYSSGYCLALMTREHELNGGPTKPLYMNTCSTTWYPLCELVM